MATDNQQPTPPPVIQEDTTSGKTMILTMGIIGLLCAILIVVTYRTTFATIEDNKARYLEQAVFEVLPDTREKITFTVEGDELRPLQPGEKAEVEYYAGYNDKHQLTGVAVPTEGQGFQDTLSILYGWSPKCHCIVGMKVLESRETPGLGDRIETDPDFRANFDALSVALNSDKTAIANPITLVKHGKKTHPWEIDAISGATISSRAVADMLHRSTVTVIPLLERNLATLEQEPRP